MSNYSDSYFDANNANTSWYKVFHLIPEKSHVLDVGCSSGNFGKVLIDAKKCKVDGIEIDQNDFKQAKKKLENVYQLNIETDDLRVIKNKYDIIYFGDVIEHLVWPVETLQRVKQLLNKDGRIVFSIPNMGHVAVRLLLLKGDFDYTESGLLDKTHLHYYTLDEVNRVFAESGYKIQTIDFVEKDYPKSLIKEWLSGLGLKADNAFYDAMAKPDAAAFQFIGVSKPQTNVAKPKKRAQFGPIDLFESFHTNTLKGLNAEVKALLEQNKVLDHENNALNERWRQFKRNPAKVVGKKIYKKLKSS